MARRGEIEWLLNELPTLTANGVLSPEAAERLRQYYGQGGREARSWLTIIFSAIGALLIGGGVISLLAYNWDAFSRPVRAAFAYLPLVVGQLGVARVLARGGSHTSAREGWGTFLFLAVGACLGLIAQTYHLGGRFDTFLLVWMLLGFPLAYVLEAAVPAALAMIGFTVWAILWESHGGSGLWLWPLGFLALAAAWPVLRDETQAPRAAIVTTIGSLMLWHAAGLTLARVEIGDKIFSFVWPVGLGVGAAMYVLGACAQHSRWMKTVMPVHRLGALLTVCLSICLTYANIWRIEALVFPPRVLAAMASAAPLEAWAVAVLLLAVLLGVAGAYVAAIIQQEWAALWLGSAPLVYALAVATGKPWAAATVMNVYVLAAGVAGVVMGVRARNAQRAYSGLAVIVFLIGFRFFDTELGFVARGIVFILLGLAFIAAQRFLARRLRMER